MFVEELEIFVVKYEKKMNKFEMCLKVMEVECDVFVGE